MKTKSTAMTTLALGLLLATAPAGAITYRSAYLTSWSGCECAEPGLSYTDDQINYFNSRMSAKGHTSLGTYANQDAWATDTTEDRAFNGSDNSYSDDAVAWAFSGHGAAYTDASGQQRFSAPMCFKGNAEYAGDCNWKSVDTRLGEQAGTYYAWPNPGNNRYLVLATCFSVHTSPHQQWSPTMNRGTEFVMGYRGLSADSETTDEVLGDWVNNAYAGTVYTFKSSWFNAITDWWINDTGAVVSGGTSSSNAAWSRDNYSRSTARRRATDSWTYYAWSWFEG